MRAVCDGLQAICEYQFTCLTFILTGASLWATTLGFGDHNWHPLKRLRPVNGPPEIYQTPKYRLELLRASISNTLREINEQIIKNNNKRIAADW